MKWTWFDDIRWDAFCVAWRLIGNELLQTIATHEDP